MVIGCGSLHPTLKTLVVSKGHTGRNRSLIPALCSLNMNRINKVFPLFDEAVSEHWWVHDVDY